MGEDKFDLDYVGEVVERASCGHYHWEMLWASLKSDCRGNCSGFYFQSPETVQNVFVYRPDCLFRTMTGFWEVIPVNYVNLRTYRTDHR